MGETYYKRRALGLCGRCGSSNVEEGYVNCAECREKQRLKVEAYKLNCSYEEYKQLQEYARYSTYKQINLRKEQGLCSRCGKIKVKKGYTNCAYCRTLHNSKQRTRYKQRKEEMRLSV